MTYRERFGSSPGTPASEERAPESSTSLLNRTRRTIDLVVQTSTIELFRSYGMAIAPLPKRRPEPLAIPADALGGGVPIQGPGVAGDLLLTIERLALDALGGATPLGPQDWVRELANQLLGRIKNRFVRYDYRLRQGPPFLLEGRALTHRLNTANPDHTYPFRGVRGVVVVTLHGTLEPQGFSNTPGGHVATEGDLIVF